MLVHYVKVALRNLWRNKVFSAINIAGLSVGLACCMLIVLYLKDEVSFDKFHAKKDRIYRITTNMKSPSGEMNNSGITGMVQGPAFSAAIPEIESYVRIKSEGFTIRKGNQIFDQPALAVDENFFEVFNFGFKAGSAQTAFKDMHQVVLSEAAAKKYFGDKPAIGQTLEIKYEGKFEPFVVSAVSRTAPQNSSIQFDLLFPMKFEISRGNNNEWVSYFLNTFLVLKPGADPKRVAAQFDGIFKTQAAAELKEAREKYNFQEQISFGLQPLLDVHLSKTYPAMGGLDRGSNPVYAYILGGIAIFILLIACLNFINLTVARSLKRAKEIGIRKVVGSQKRQLILQFLGESMILTFFSFLLAILIVLLVLPVFNSLANKALAFSYLIDARLVGAYIGLFLLTGLLAGIYPALVIATFNPVQSLYGKQFFHGKNYLSKAMVVFQFTLASILIISTLVIYNQFNFLLHTDLGYNDKNVGIVNTGHIDQQTYQSFKAELLKNPKIESVTADQGGRWMTVARINGKDDVNFEFKYIDANYLPLFKIPLVAGRNFNPDLSSDTASAVLVNESFVKKAGWKEPIGQIVDFFYNNKKFTVIGVVKDYHYGSLTEPINPEVMIAHPQYQFADIFMKIQPGETAATQAYVAATFKKFFPFQPYEFRSKDLENERQYEAERKWKEMISYAAVLTIFISCIGLFGLAVFSAEKRTKEIGIRKVLGASVTNIVATLSLDFLKLVVLATIIACPIAWWAMQQWLEHYPYRVSISGWVFVLTLLVASGLALLTIGYQAIRSALANPVNSLKSE